MAQSAVRPRTLLGLADQPGAPRTVGPWIGSFVALGSLLRRYLSKLEGRQLVLAVSVPCRDYVAALIGSGWMLSSPAPVLDEPLAVFEASDRSTCLRAVTEKSIVTGRFTSLEAHSSGLRVRTGGKFLPVDRYRAVTMLDGECESAVGEVPAGGYLADLTGASASWLERLAVPPMDLALVGTSKWLREDLEALIGDGAAEGASGTPLGTYVLPFEPRAATWSTPIISASRLGEGEALPESLLGRNPRSLRGHQVSERRDGADRRVHRRSLRGGRVGSRDDHRSAPQQQSTGCGSRRTSLATAHGSRSLGLHGGHMSRAQDVARRYLASGSLMRQGVSIFAVGDPAGAQLNAAIRRTLFVLGDERSEVWNGVLQAANALRWRRMTQPQPREFQTQQPLIDEIVRQAKRLRNLVTDGALLDLIAEGAVAVGETDSPVGAVLLESIQEVGPESCVVVASKGAARAGLASWLDEVGATVLVPSELDTVGAGIETSYVIAPADFHAVIGRDGSNDPRSYLRDARLVR
jgi:hypothetical protein